MLHSEKWQ